MDIIYQPVSVSLNWNSENYNIVSQIRTKPYEPYRTDRIIQYPVSSSIELLDDKSFYEYLKQQRKQYESRVKLFFAR